MKHSNALDAWLPRRGGCVGLLLCGVLLVGVGGSTPAFAVNKDMVELQTQVQGLQDAIARLQQSNDERMGVLKDLVQQSADSVNKMSLVVDSLEKQMQAQQESSGGKLDQVSGQVQTLSDSVDEIKARMGRLEKALQDLQSQTQSINANLQNLAPTAAGGAAVPAAAAPGVTDMPATAPTQALPGTTGRRGKPSAAVPMAAADTTMASPMAAPVAPAAAPPAADLYKTALSDYMSAKYTLAASEFAEVSRMYSDDPLAGNSFYYQGEIDYRAGKYAAAVKDYDHVLDQFPDSPKVAVAHLHKGMALFELRQNDAAVRELRTLISRFPNSPESAQARSKLNGMGIPIVPRQR